MSDKILLSHGSGGLMSDRLIREMFLACFDNDYLSELSDSAVLPTGSGKISFTTDSYVVDPVFFPGGNIGKLAVCGTVNDLAVSGAIPKYISAGFILEEGLAMEDLEKIVKSMAEEAKKAGVKIVTGDTKIVNKGKADKIFINTAGVGFLPEENVHISKGEKIKTGDKIIVNGSMGEHGVAVMSTREDLKISSPVYSDCASLNHLIKKVLDKNEGIKFMRDLTRGGLASVLVEIVEQRNVGIRFKENEVPVSEKVQALCEMLGFDPLYLANEGKIVMIVSSGQAESILQEMKKDPLGKDSSIIGEIVNTNHGKVVMETEIGGSRIVDKITGEQLPRIC
jgi:hydrogenase expression/formation protein HypE